MSIRLYRSNRLERLADALATVIDEPMGGPLAPDRLVVQSPGMFEWVASALAERRGISANMAWWRPRQMVQKLLSSGLSQSELPARVDGGMHDPWERENLTWVLMRMLPEVVDQPGFEIVQQWLVNGKADRRFQLARRIAHVFDQYTVYRPKMVLGWRKQPELDWQCQLWSRLERELGGKHLAHLVRRFAAAVEESPRPDKMPNRLCVFGLTTLPPLFVEVLNAASQWCEVHVFQLAPSAEWFAEISSPREKARHVRGREPDYGEEAEEAMHLEEGHPLLSRLGQVGRDFQWVLEDRLEYQEDHVDRFEESEGESMLATLQNDLREMRHRKADDRVAIDPSDRSIQVHGCHSPVREVEVLRDQLHALFEADPTLRPRDVVVLMPDINEHGPLVEAVFGINPNDPLHIPYTIADKPLASGNVVARALFSVLDLVGSRIEASAILELLAHAPVRERFGFDERELDHVQEMLEIAGVRWGLDGDHRTTFGQPDNPIGTWQAGLDRLMLGYTMGGVAPMGEVVPVEDIDADAASLLERVSQLFQDVVTRIQNLERDRPMATWQTDLTQLLEALFVDSHEHFEALQSVRTALATAEEHARVAGFTQPVPLSLIRSTMERHLTSERRPGAFMRAGVTFCEMLPMRAIPFEVVGLLGMSDGAFPRSDSRLGFDRIAAKPQRGDRSKRLDDRFILLEAVLSARRAVIATYRSRSVKDNTELPPSVVLAELLDVLDEGFTSPEGTPVREQVTVEHPLQPFSPSYLGSHPALFTYDEMASDGARSLFEASGRPPPFFADLLPEEPLERVDLDDLAAFVQDSVRWFMERRLQVRPVDEATVVRDREPMQVRGLDDYQLGARVLELRLQDLEPDEAWQVAASEARLPLGALGDAERVGVGAKVEALLDAAGEHLDAARLDEARFEYDLEGVRFTGLLDQLRRTSRVSISYRSTTDRQARILMRPWVYHLALQLHPDPALPRTTSLYAQLDKGEAGAFRTLPAMSKEDARHHLSNLLKWYRIGTREPVWFLPDAGWALLAKSSRQGATWEGFRAAQNSARQQWRTDVRSRSAWQALAGGDEAFSTRTRPKRTFEAAQGILVPLRDVLGVRR